MRAFNGPGLTRTSPTTTGTPTSTRSTSPPTPTSGSTASTPTPIGMDEDYDACDLENWFLAIQSADGQVMIPSFHRPGILTAADWTRRTPASAQRSKILRPRQVDNSPLFPPDPSHPRPADRQAHLRHRQRRRRRHRLGLARPRLPGPARPRRQALQAPVRLHGPRPQRPAPAEHRRQPPGPRHRRPDEHSGQSRQYPYPGPDVPRPRRSPRPGPATRRRRSPTPALIPPRITAPDSIWFNPSYSSQTYLDAPLWDHASHLGYSVNEINPKFALQNAPSNVYTSVRRRRGRQPLRRLPQLQRQRRHQSYSQYDNAGVSVALTQLRNILAGTVPTDIREPARRRQPHGPGAANGNVTRRPTTT